MPQDNDGSDHAMMRMFNINFISAVSWPNPAHLALVACQFQRAQKPTEDGAAQSEITMAAICLHHKSFPPEQDSAYFPLKNNHFHFQPAAGKVSKLNLFLNMFDKRRVKTK